MSNRHNQIDEIAAAWKHACAAHPEQRAGQVLVNAVGDPFYQKCDQIIDGLDAYAKVRHPHERV